MISSARLVIVSSLLMAGCHTAEKVAVTTFRVVDAPAKFIRQRIDSSEQPAPEHPVSDVGTPGRPVNVSTPTPTPHRVVTQSRSTTTVSATPKPHPEATVVSRRSVPSPTPRSATTQNAQFPTARPVPGKPGYVYSVDPKGGIVDVTGYKSGDKAKDPYTQQIFIVP